MLPPPPNSTLFPYTTLFRSLDRDRSDRPTSRATPTPRGRNRTRGLQRRRRSPRVRFRPRGVGRSEEPRLNSSHPSISYAVFCLKKKKDIIKSPVTQWRAYSC